MATEGGDDWRLIGGKVFKYEEDMYLSARQGDTVGPGGRIDRVFALDAHVFLRHMLGHCSATNALDGEVPSKEKGRTPLAQCGPLAKR